LRRTFSNSPSADRTAAVKSLEDAPVGVACGGLVAVGAAAEVVAADEVVVALLMRCSHVLEPIATARWALLLREGSPILSHASSRHPAGCKPEVSHTRRPSGQPR
jgi:hypothetical protein